MTTTRPLRVGYTVAALRASLILSVVMLAAVAYDAFLAVGDGGHLLFVVILICLVPAATTVIPLSLRAAWRAVRRRPLLTLDDTGVTLHSARVSLPWSGLAEIRITRTPRRGRDVELLVFVAAAPEQLLAGLRGLPRWFAGDGIRRTGGPVFLRVQDLSCPLDDVLTATRQWTDVPVTRRTMLANDRRRLV